MLPGIVRKKKDRLALFQQVWITTCLSGGLSLCLSITSITLSVWAIMVRYNCSMGDLPKNGSSYFYVTLIRAYILRDSCEHALQLETITKPNSVFILSIILLVCAFINMLTAITMISIVHKDEPRKHLDIYIYVYLGSSLALLIVDLTMGVHFGMDLKTMKRYLDVLTPGIPINYTKDMIRLAALLLMSIALKGYIGHLINIVLLVLLLVSTIRYQKLTNNIENLHSIHTFGAINGFESSYVNGDQWSPRSDNLTYFSRGPSMTDLNIGGERHYPLRETTFGEVTLTPPREFQDVWVPISTQRNNTTAIPRGDLLSVAYDGDGLGRLNLSSKDTSTSDRLRNRSPSWLHNSGAAQPFSYLEDPRKPLPVKPSPTATTEPQWRRDAWPPAVPPVPAPDYSPPPRRLKSALKSNYI